jgi:hypothetical protein
MTITASISAEALMGSARVTYDVDLCGRRTPENSEPIGAYEDVLPHVEAIKRLREQEGLS